MLMISITQGAIALKILAEKDADTQRLIKFVNVAQTDLDKDLQRRKAQYAHLITFVPEKDKAQFSIPLQDITLIRVINATHGLKRYFKNFDRRVKQACVTTLIDCRSSLIVLKSMQTLLDALKVDDTVFNASHLKTSQDLSSCEMALRNETVALDKLKLNAEFFHDDYLDQLVKTHQQLITLQTLLSKLTFTDAFLIQKTKLFTLELETQLMAMRLTHYVQLKDLVEAADSLAHENQVNLGLSASYQAIDPAAHILTLSVECKQYMAHINALTQLVQKLSQACDHTEPLAFYSAIEPDMMAIETAHDKVAANCKIAKKLNAPTTDPLNDLAILQQQIAQARRYQSLCADFKNNQAQLIAQQAALSDNVERVKKEVNILIAHYYQPFKNVDLQANALAELKSQCDDVCDLLSPNHADLLLMIFEVIEANLVKHRTRLQDLGNKKLLSYQSVQSKFYLARILKDIPANSYQVPAVIMANNMMDLELQISQQALLRKKIDNASTELAARHTTVKADIEKNYAQDLSEFTHRKHATISASSVAFQQYQIVNLKDIRISLLNIDINHKIYHLKKLYPTYKPAPSLSAPSHDEVVLVARLKQVNLDATLLPKKKCIDELAGRLDLIGTQYFLLKTKMLFAPKAKKVEAFRRSVHALAANDEINSEQKFTALKQIINTFKHEITEHHISNANFIAKYLYKVGIFTPTLHKAIDYLAQPAITRAAALLTAGG